MRKTLWYLVAVLCVALVLLLTRPVPASSLALPWQLESIVEMHTSTTKCTGFIIRRGLVITAGHCIHPTDNVQLVRFTDGAIRPYKLVSMQFAQPIDCAHDWALVMTDTAQRKPLEFGRTPKQGDTLVRIGYPMGFRKQVARIGRVTSVEHDYVEMSNTASPGESGAPILDNVGRVVGLVDCFDTRMETALGGEARLFRDAVAQVSK